METLFRIGRIKKSQDVEEDKVIQEIATKVENAFGVGTSAPDSDTPGNVFYKYDSSDTTATLVVYIKIGSDWYGA